MTGGGALSKNSQYVPITLEQIANEAIAAARAASVHIHVRDPVTGAPSTKLELYDEVMQRIRQSGVDMIINLTAGPGAGYDPPLEEGAASGLTVRPPHVRTDYVSRLRPDICTPDVATMNFGDRAIVNTPPRLIAMSRSIQAAGVKPELEVFDIGHVGLAVRLLEGAPAQAALLPVLPRHSGRRAGHHRSHAADAVPGAPGTIWSAFGISRFQMTMVAQSVILGGHCRVGLEGNLFLERGVLAEGNAPWCSEPSRSSGRLAPSPQRPRKRAKFDACLGPETGAHFRETCFSSMQCRKLRGANFAFYVRSNETPGDYVLSER